jgi:hypothetical protein
MKRRNQEKAFLLLLLLTFHSAHWRNFFCSHSPAFHPSAASPCCVAQESKRRKERLCHYCVTFTYLFKCLRQRDKFIESFTSEFSKPTITPIFHMPLAVDAVASQLILEKARRSRNSVCFEGKHHRRRSPHL